MNESKKLTWTVNRIVFLRFPLLRAFTWNMCRQIIFRPLRHFLLQKRWPITHRPCGLYCGGNFALVPSSAGLSSPGHHLHWVASLLSSISATLLSTYFLYIVMSPWIHCKVVVESLQKTNFRTLILCALTMVSFSLTAIVAAWSSSLGMVW